MSDSPILPPLRLLLNLGEQAILRVPLGFQRSKIAELTPNRRLLIVRGPRGVGKTTLLQQYAQQQFSPAERVYLSLDDIYFSNHRLVDTVHALQANGYTRLVLDEIHRYAGWEQELKNCYDRYPHVRILATGSSMLELGRGGGDLSRRAYVLSLPVLTFREYLLFSEILVAPTISLDDLLRSHEAFHEELERLHGALQPHFEDYLRYGAYPSTILDPSDARTQLRNVSIQIIDRDITPVAALQPTTVVKLHQLLALISEQVPFKPTISKLAAQLKTGRELVVQLLDLLDRSGIIFRIWYESGGDNRLSKPDKVFLDNPNLCYAFHAIPNRGTLRETFFATALRSNYSLSLSKIADFESGHYTFELGGPGKTFKQLRKATDGYLVVDQFERGAPRRIPLYLFGFVE